MQEIEELKKRIEELERKSGQTIPWPGYWPNPNVVPYPFYPNQPYPFSPITYCGGVVGTYAGAGTTTGDALKRI